MNTKKSALLALLAVSAYGQQDFAKCSCDSTAFMSSLKDDRLCLKKADDHGIANCVEYDFDATYGLKCTKCAPTHAVGKHGQECHEHGLDSCISAEINAGTEFGAYTFKCLDCSDGKQVDETASHVCIDNPTTAIPKCEKYIKVVGGQKCIKCDGTSYLKNSAQEATCTDFDAPANCDSYEKVDEQNLKCATCANTHPLKQEDGSACHVAGTGIAGCSEYYHDGALKCKTCESDKTKWTGENGCTTTPTNILGCSKYVTTNGSAWTCGECEASKVIANDNGSCNEPQAAQDAMNCQVYKTSGTWTCKDCKSSHPVKQANEQLCKATPTDETTAGGASRWTENCAEWSHDNTNYACTKCDQHYFLDSGKCKKAEREIEHCTTYSDVYTCSHCDDKYALEHNGCWKCPDEIYVPPQPVVCPSNGGTPSSNNTGNTNTTDPNNTSSGALLNAGIMFLLALIMF